MSVDVVQPWIADRLSIAEEAGAPVAFGLAHRTNNNEEVPVYVVKAGMPIWGDAAKMAEAIDTNATRYARGIMGHVSFTLGAVYKDSGRALLTLPFLKAGATNIGGGLGIDPSPLGQNIHAQRLIDVMAMGVLKERADVVHTYERLVSMLSAHVLAANEDAQKTRTAFFELEEKVRASQHASKMEELGYDRNTMLLTEGIKYAPLAINQITGRKWVPEALERATFEEQWLANHTDAEIEAEIALQQTREPLYAAFLASRLVEVKRRQIEEAKLRTKMSGKAPKPPGPDVPNAAPPNGLPAEPVMQPPEGQMQPHVDITRDHALPLPALRAVVEAMVVKLHETMDFEHTWEEGERVARVAFANADGLSGAIDLADGKVRVRVVLPGMLARIMKGPIAKQIEEELTKALAAAQVS